MTDSKVFFDTAPFIYYLENDGDFKVKTKKVISDHEEADFVTSTVTVGEYLTGHSRMMMKSVCRNLGK